MRDIAGETTALAVGDINKDNYLEIAFGVKRATSLAIAGPAVTVYTNVVCVFKYDGSLFWESGNDPNWVLSAASPVIGDIKDAHVLGSNKEVIFWGTNLDTGYPQIRVYNFTVDLLGNYTGSILAKYEVPVIAQENSLSSAAIARLDNLRNAHLVFVAQQPQGTPQRSALMVWDTGADYYHTQMDWPQFAHDAGHTSNYHYNQLDYFLKGDVDKDGDITMHDVYLAGRQASGLDAYTIEADMDNNGRITLDDITAIAYVYMKRDPAVPVAYKVAGLLKDIPAQKAAAGGLVSFKADALSGAIRPFYVFVSRPSGASINTSDGQVRWQTTSRQGGKYNIKLRAYYRLEGKTANYLYDEKDVPVTVQAVPAGNLAGVVYEKRGFGWWSWWSRYYYVPVSRADVFVSRLGVTYWATTNYSGAFTLKNLPEGAYAVTISKRGLAAQRANIFVRANTTTQQTFYLAK